jgi:hypothetical protein
MATTTPNYGWSVPTSTDLVKDGATAIETLGDSADATVKALNPETTLGDLAYRSATANVKTRLGIGTTGQVLTVSGGVPAWASPAGGGGKVLQVVQGTINSTVNVAGTTYGDVVSVSITPSANTSKVLFMIHNPQRTITSSGDTALGYFKILRGSTALQDEMISTGHLQTSGNFGTWSTFAFAYLDSPATTSATTYKLQARGQSGTTVQNNYNAVTNGTTIIAMEIGA